MEHYLTIEDHPNYEVSNLGNVRNKKTGTVRALTNRRGYLKVRLDNKDESVHRLVAETFFDGDHTGYQVNHIDGNKSNNRLGNLEWVTASENVKHAFDNDLKKPSGGYRPHPVVDNTTGRRYESVADCSRDIGGTKAGVRWALKYNKPYKNHDIKRCQ